MPLDSDDRLRELERFIDDRNEATQRAIQANGDRMDTFTNRQAEIAKAQAEHAKQLTSHEFHLEDHDKQFNNIHEDFGELRRYFGYLMAGLIFAVVTGILGLIGYLGNRGH